MGKLSPATRRRMEEKERCGRTITSNILNDRFKTNKTDINIVGTGFFDGCDLIVTCSGKKKVQRNAMEVKMRNKTDKQLQEYPCCELKEEKYNKMVAFAKDKGVDNLLYTVLLNEKEYYIFNLSKIDMSKCNKVMWENIKYVQEEDSEDDRRNYMIYQIPPSLSCYSGTCENYFEEYKSKK
ncbi:hypothetical protein HDR70_00285 [bacterium]|nr:hypothetical protein [bacterium]